MGFLLSQGFHQSQNHEKIVKVNKTKILKLKNSTQDAIAEQKVNWMEKHPVKKRKKCNPLNLWNQKTLALLRWNRCASSLWWPWCQSQQLRWVWVVCLFNLHSGWQWKVANCKLLKKVQKKRAKIACYEKSPRIAEKAEEVEEATQQTTLQCTW